MDDISYESYAVIWRDYLALLLSKQKNMEIPISWQSFLLGAYSTDVAMLFEIFSEGFQICLDQLFDLKTSERTTTTMPRFSLARLESNLVAIGATHTTINIFALRKVAKSSGKSIHELCTADLGPIVPAFTPSPLVLIRTLKIIPSGACFIQQRSLSQLFGGGNETIQKVMQSIPKCNLPLPRTCWQFYCNNGILAFLKVKKTHGWRYLLGSCNPLCGAFDAVITKYALFWDCLLWIVQQHKEEKQFEIKLLAPPFVLPAFCQEVSNNGQWFLYRIGIHK